MAKKKADAPYYSPDGWFLNFLFMAILISGLFAATVLVQRRAQYVNKAAEKPPAVEIMHPSDKMMEDEMMMEGDVQIYP